MAEPTLQQRVSSNFRQQSRVAYKRREVLRLADAIRDQVEDMGTKLPRTYVDYQDYKCKLLEQMGYDVTDDLIAHWDEQHEELIRLQYTLRRTNKAVYALFENKDKVVKPQLVSMWYTKHRMDEVWLMRKSQLIRSIYREYLQTATVPTGELLIRKYIPCHLVLTLPHDAEGYGGKKFYLKELLSLFHELRRSKEWKSKVYGGEYGAEIKKSNNGNGLHIHIHSMLFLKETSINAFRDTIRRIWERITENPGHAFIHLEQLYTYKRDEKGKWITRPGKKKNEKTGEWEDLYDIRFMEQSDEAIITAKEVRKKHYIGPESNVEDYLQGVMECIKYHFKSDTYKKEDGSFDLDLIKDILNNSKRMRFYSRFGAFYKCKELNFDNQDDESDEAPVEEAEDKLNGSAGRGVKNLVNPWTMEPALDKDYDFAVASPEMLKYRPGSDLLNPNQLLTFGSLEFTRVAKGIDITGIVQAMVLGKLAPILMKNGKHAAYYDWSSLNST